VKADLQTRRKKASSRLAIKTQNTSKTNSCLKNKNALSKRKQGKQSPCNSALSKREGKQKPCN